MRVHEKHEQNGLLRRRHTVATLLRAIRQGQVQEKGGSGTAQWAQGRQAETGAAMSKQFQPALGLVVDVNPTRNAHPSWPVAIAVGSVVMLGLAILFGAAL